MKKEQPHWRDIRRTTFIVALLTTALTGCGGGSSGGTTSILPTGVGVECNSSNDCDNGLICQQCSEQCTGTVRRCAGSSSLINQIPLDDGTYPGGCEDMGGAWFLSEDIRGGCDTEDESGPFFISTNGSGQGEVTIQQSGCSIFYTIPLEGGTVRRRGGIAGNRIRLSGPFLLPAAGLSLSVNEAFAEGTVTEATLNATGDGIAEGQLKGFPIECSATSTAFGSRR